MSYMDHLRHLSRQEKAARRRCQYLCHEAAYGRVEQSIADEAAKDWEEKNEALGRALDEYILPEDYHAAHAVLMSLACED